MHRGWYTRGIAVVYYMGVLLHIVGAGFRARTSEKQAKHGFIPSVSTQRHRQHGDKELTGVDSDIQVMPLQTCPSHTHTPAYAGGLGVAEPTTEGKLGKHVPLDNLLALKVP